MMAAVWRRSSSCVYLTTLSRCAPTPQLTYLARTIKTAAAQSPGTKTNPTLPKATPKIPLSTHFEKKEHTKRLLQLLVLGGIFTSASFLIIQKRNDLAELKKAEAERCGKHTPSTFEKGIAKNGIFQALENALTNVSDWIHDTIDKALQGFPSVIFMYPPQVAGPPSEPLLPDARDLNYPENLPTLVLDLDKVILKMDHDRKKGWQVLRRPGAEEFFKELVYHYEIAIWSDDNFPVAQEVCTKWNLPVIGAIHRDQCKRRRGKYIKDLRRLGRDLRRVIIVDHDPVAFSEQPENAILISEFTGDAEDRELYALAKFLKMAALSENPDIRDVLRAYGEPGSSSIVKKWMVETAETEKTSESRRALGSRLFGGGGGSPLKTLGHKSLHGGFH